MIDLVQNKAVIAGLFTVIGALLAVFGGILGSLLSAWLTSREEVRRWERQKELRNYDERRRAYADLTRASWRLYQEIKAVDRKLDGVSNKYSKSETEQKVRELYELTERIRDNVNEEIRQAYGIVMEIRLLSIKPVIDAAKALAKACRALHDATANTASLMLEKMDEPVDVEHQAEQDKSVLKEDFVKKQQDFINIASNDLLGISQVVESEATSRNR
jgi:hypothetical protein